MQDNILDTPIQKDQQRGDYLIPKLCSLYLIATLSGF